MVSICISRKNIPCHTIVGLCPPISTSGPSKNVSISAGSGFAGPTLPLYFFLGGEVFIFIVNFNSNSNSKRNSKSKLVFEVIIVGFSIDFPRCTGVTNNLEHCNASGSAKTKHR